MNCDIIIDLIPVVTSGQSSEESKNEVTEHIGSCDTCRIYYEKSKSNQKNDRPINVIGYQQRVKQKKFKKAVVISGLVIILLLIQALFLTGVVSSLYILGDSYETTDINEYGVFSEHFDGEESGRFSHLMVFPDDVDSIEYYSYKSSSKGLDNSYDIEMRAIYDESHFFEELNRLEKLSLSNNGETNYIIKDLEVIGQSNYVAVFNHNHTYEYVIIDNESNQITYIYKQFEEENKSDFSYSIYYFGDYRP
jgi:hypothetical protein